MKKCRLGFIMGVATAGCQSGLILPNYYYKTIEYAA